MQPPLASPASCDLFSNRYLDERLPETEAWDAVGDEELEAAYDDIVDLWEREKRTAPKRDEARLEEAFIRRIFRKLGIPLAAAERTDRTRRRPDYGFFDSEDAARDAFERREEGGDFYENAVAVADARRWGRSLDTRGSGEHERDFEIPSCQIRAHLQETPARWAVLTDGKRWRLYCAQTSHRFDSYYEIDLPTVLEDGDLEDFKYFYLFFRHEAFLEDAGGDSFLDRVYDESNAFAQELREALQDNIYEAVEVLVEGFLQYPENDLDRNDLDEGDLQLVYDGSLVYLYRLIFVLYAESGGCDLLDPTDEIYAQSYSLHSLKREVAEELDGATPKYRDRQDGLQSRLDDLFVLVDRGSESRGIPEDDLYVPAYNGELFRTDPGEDADRESQFLAEHAVGDAALARVVELLTRTENPDGSGKRFVDYSSLDVRHLGSIYEGLLECELNVADEPLALDDGRYVSATGDDDVAAAEGQLYLATGSGERKITGSYYTPEYVVEYVVENALEPLVDEAWRLAEASAFGEGSDSGGDSTFAEAFARKIFRLEVLDPAMGSGHFLTRTVDYLAWKIIDAQRKQAAKRGVESVDGNRDVDWARRQVVRRCIYGVDRNPLAVELAKASLWLRTTAAGQPFTVLDHHLKTGNALVGSDFEEIESQAPTDVTNPEATSGEFDRDKLRQRLEAVLNVHTAEKFGLDDLPSDAYERMATALETDGDWEDVERSRWFQEAQARAEGDQYFHWKLEYPEVFCDESGDERSDSGFDAVVGNPPYIRNRNLPGAHKEFYKDHYRSAKGAYDIYIPFLERAADLGNRSSFVVPNKWTTTDYGERLREILLKEYDLRELVDVSHLNVFPDADIYPLIVSYSSDRDAAKGDLSIRHVEEPNSIDSATEVRLSRDIVERLGGRAIPVNLTPEFAPLIEKALARETRLGDHVEMTEGIHTGNVREKLVVDEEVDETCEKLVDGKSIGRYRIEWSGRWIRYDEDSIDGESGEYADLRTRELFDRDEKLFIRDISHRPVAAYDDGQLFASNTLYSVTRKESSDYSLKYLLAIFNSEFVDRYFRQVYGGTHVSGDYLRFKPMFSYDVPIPEPDSEGLPDELERQITAFDSEVDTSSTVAAIEDLTDVVRDAKGRKSDCDPNLLDLLGEYSEGRTLAEVPEYQPPEGVSNSPLSETASTLENLRVGSVEISEEGDALTVSVSARYKPEEADEFETDRWGYVETDSVPAMEFVGLGDTERLLVREFVPHAVEEAGGFAEFRETATKTNSLIDRLAALTLPAVSDVEPELNRYRERIRTARRSDERAKTADEILDEIVYELYGLTEDEKAVIEAMSE